jgi:hypothetical protein
MMSAIKGVITHLTHTVGTPSVVLGTRQASSLQVMVCRGDTCVARESVFNGHLLTVYVR